MEDRNPSIESPILQIRGLSRIFNPGPAQVAALKNINLDLEKGRFTALRGISGSGKTTLLNIIGLLDQPTTGTVILQGEDVTSASEQRRTEIRRTQVGYIFQSVALIAYMTAYENVEFMLRVAGYPADKREERAKECLQFVGLGKRMHHRVHELSGGEQQRVAIARAVSTHPVLLLADEPTAELDSAMGLQILKVFRDLVEAEGVSIVITSHDDKVMEVVDHVYNLKDGEILA